MAFGLLYVGNPGDELTAKTDRYISRLMGKNQFDVPLRVRSMRAYRRMADRILKEAIEGKRSARDAAALMASIKGQAEMFMAENMLTRAGQDKEVDNHTMGDDGGLAMPQTGMWRRKKVKATTGLDRFGARIDNKSVEIETSADDVGAEEEVELDTLA